MFEITTELETLSDVAFEGIVIHDERIILFANSTFATMIGYSKSELLHMDGMKFVPLQYREIVDRHLHQHSAKPYIISILRKDGSSFFAEIRGKELSFQGKKCRVVAVRDITKQVETENFLNQSKQKYQLLVESLPEVVVTFDRNFKVLFISPTIEKLCQRKPEEFLHKPLALFLHQADQSTFEEYIDNPQEQRHRYYRLLAKNGEYKHICILLNKKKTCSSDPEIAGILTDVTNHIQEKKEHEQLRRQLAEVEKLTIVGQLALAITHEIRNSTEIIHNKLLLLKKDISFLAKSEKAILLITKIENQISQLVLVANDLLRYSKPRDKNKSLININNVIAHTLKMHFDDIERIKFQKDENIPLIKGDAIGLEIVFKNIILNALAASDNKNEIICRSIKLNQGNVKITFQDFGFGISADDLKNVFDPFFTRKYGRRGTGLGLAICKQIIEAHQGSIKIKSTAGKGTLVSILLPYQT